ncbi:MAG: ABC transporter substrate-binding protein, partial [Eubacterium sp.]
MAVSCFKKADTQNDVLTQTAAAEDKIPVTVLVKYAFTINNFEKEIEKKFPNLDLIQVGNYTSDMGKDEYAARLEHDDLTDVVMTWPLEVGEEYWDDRLIDLSSLPLSGKYNTNMLDTISKDGKLYYLPGPSQIRGILYNKTLFKEMGWDVPKDFEGFLALCDQIEKSGIRSLQLGLKNEEVFDTAFTGFGYANSFSKPEDAQWIDNYNNGKGSFGDHFIPALNTYKTLIDRGILKKEDLNIDYSDREKMFFTRKCAMIEDSVLMARMGNNTTGTNDEFGLMPFLNPAPDSDWARLYPVCYIGLNKNLESSKNKEKYDLIMELLEYISTPEGQTLLASDTGGMLSSLNGTKPPNVPEIDALFSTLTHGRYAVFTELQNAQSALREGLAGMLQGKLTTADVIKMVDQENSSPPQKPLPAVFGHASDDFTLMETGN